MKENLSIHNLKDIINEVKFLTEVKSKMNNVQVYYETEKDFNINCDDIEIEQVFINLVGNAIDAVKDLDEKWVKVRTYEDKMSTIIEIIDSGKGIPREIRNKLFDPFFTTKEIGQGTGLGLSISKGILQSHNATISILENVPNTCFEIRFLKL
jgi:C4-dicarboxylate-specific signal transduction histidine kinase